MQENSVNDPKVVLTAIILGTVGVLSFIVQPGLVQGYALSFGIGEDQANYLAFAEGMGITLATILVALFSKIFSWRHIVALSLLLAVIGNVAAATIETPNSTFKIMRFVTGLGEGGIIAMSFAIIGLTRRVERNLAYYLVLLLTYGALGLWAMPAALNSIGLSGIFWGWAAISAVSAVMLKSIPKGAESRVEPNPNAVNVKFPILIMGLVAVLAYNTAIGLTWANLFFVGLEVSNNPQKIANALLICQFVAIIGALIPVFLETKLGRLIPLMTGGLIGAGSIALLLGKPGYALFVFAICAFNFMWNFFLPFMLSTIEDMRKGEIITVAIACQMMGLVALGPFVAGKILETGGTLQKALATAVTLIVLSVIMLAITEISRRKTLQALTNGNS